MKAESMSSRRRVTEAINHRIPDRMPIDLGAHTATGISAFAYFRLREYLNLSTDNIEIHDGVQVTARVDEDILERFHCDCILLKPKAANYYKWNPRGRFTFTVPSHYSPMLNERGEWVVEKNGKRMRMPDGGFFFDGDWLEMNDRWESGFFDETVREAERIYKETDYFTIFRGFYPFFNSSVDYFCDMITNQDELIERNAAALGGELKRAARFVDNMRDYVGAVCMSGDLGGQTSPMVRPEVFEAVSAPFLKEFTSFMHKYSDAKVFLHSCGAIEPLIPVLIDCGIDIINPVQISAGGMDPASLKRKYGDKIVFWGGGVNTQEVLSFKPPAEVSANAKYLTDIFKPGGGYVFCPVHNIMGDVEPENIIAAYDAAYENSFYEIN